MSDIPSRLSQWEPSRLMKTTFLAFAATCVIALFFAKVFQATVVERRKVEAAMQVVAMSGAAPSFTLADRSGRQVSLEELRGKVVFLNFWATWCGPCREEMPSLARLAGQIDGQDAVFVAVSVDEGWEAVDGFVGERPMPFTMLLDRDQSVAGAYGTRKFPESYVIGREGQLLYKVVGARDWDATAARKLLELSGARRARVIGDRS